MMCMAAFGTCSQTAACFLDAAECRDGNANAVMSAACSLYIVGSLSVLAYSLYMYLMEGRPSMNLTIHFIGSMPLYTHL